MFREGFNCAQSILTSFAPFIKLNEHDALRTSSAFGGGMGRQQEICGVLTGAYMVIGCLYGKTTADDDEANERTIELVKDITGRFAALHGNTHCRMLIGADLNTPEGREHIEMNDLFSKRCELYIETVCHLLKEITVSVPFKGNSKDNDKR